jgi:quercetin dioxygenase-like cupin family protein
LITPGRRVVVTGHTPEARSVIVTDHSTPTLDFIYVARGEFALEVDRAEKRLLRAGDSALLNGVWHRWHNRGEVGATLVAGMIGASTSRIPN